jgi:two-component system, OmpR family, catabolic regulation response regulator CreB
MIISEPVGKNQTRSNLMHAPSHAGTPDLNNDGAAILLIEDDPAIAETIGFALRQGGFEVNWCAQGLLGLAQFQEQAPDLVILDVGLPDLGGFEVCRRIRQINQTPVLFLTAHSDEIDRIQGFELGADDYISKPFSPRELVSRVRAILRRAGTVSPTASTTQSSTDLLTSGSIRCFLDQARVMVGQTTLSLTRTEFKLLEHLMRSPLRVFSREQLLNALQGAGSPTGDRAIDTHIKTLRAKIDQAKTGLDPIKTHRGLGYSFEPES